MGDRCDFVCYLERNDWTDCDEFETCIKVYDEAANYGYYDELVMAAQEGLMFFGNHTAGDNYGPMVFCGVNGEYHKLYTTYDGEEVIKVDENGPLMGELRKAKNYFAALKEVKDALRYDILSEECL